MKFKRGVTAHDVAQIHLHLGQARLSILRAMHTDKPGGASPIAADSQDTLLALAHRLHAQMFSLESEFMALTGGGSPLAGDGSPLANADNPNAWIEWLNQVQLARL